MSEATIARKQSMLDLRAIFEDDSELDVAIGMTSESTGLSEMGEVGDMPESWQATLESLEDDPLVPPDLSEPRGMAEFRPANEPPHDSATDAGGGISQASDQYPEDFVVPDNQFTPCPKCGSLEVWVSVAGDMYGRTPGVLHCMICDPPTAARRLRKLAEQIRGRERNRRATGRSGQ